MKLTLNSLEYWLRGGLNQGRFPQWPQQVRTTGEQRRSDRRPIPQWAPSDLTSGLGRKFYKEDEASYLFGTALTLWPYQVTLPLLEQVAASNYASGTTPSTPLFAHIWFKGFLFALGIRRSSGDELFIYRWGSSGWANTSLTAIITSNLNTQSFGNCDLTIVGDYLYCSGWSTAASGHSTYRSSDGVSWSVVQDAAAAAIILSGSGIRIVGDSTWCYAGHGTATVTKFKHGANPVVVGAIPTGLSPKGAVMYADKDNTAYPMFGCAEGVYLADTTNNKVILYLDLSGIVHVDNCRGMRVSGGFLMIPIRDAGLIQYHYTGIAALIGLDSRDGVPAAYAGSITATAASRFLFFAAVKGASRSGIFVWDGLGWHLIWDYDGSNEIPGLGLAGGYGGATFPPSLFFDIAPLSHRKIENIHTNPLEVSGVKYAAEGYIDYPHYGGDVPEAMGAFFNIGAYASQLTATEVIEIYYVLDEGSLILQGTINNSVRSLNLGTGGLGLEGRTLQMRAKLLRGSTNTATPVLKLVSLGHVRYGAMQRQLSFTIDLLITAQKTGRNLDTLVGELEALQGQRLLLSAQWQGLTSSVSIYLEGVSLREEQEGNRRIPTAQVSAVRLT